MRSVNQFQARLMPSKGERNTRPSETIPDQSISPQELLRRYATGQPLGFKNVSPVYDDEDSDQDVPEFYKMDKLDRLHMLQENSEKLIEARENLKAYQRIEQQRQFETEQKEALERQENAANSDQSAANESNNASSKNVHTAS